MKRREEKKWRWELEEPKKEIIVPTQKEKVQLGLTDEEWIMICYKKHKNGKCFRESSGHKLCKLCPKSTLRDITAIEAKEIEALLVKTMKKLIQRHRKRPYYRR